MTKELKTFAEIVYERPNFEELKSFYEKLNARVKAADSYAEVRQCILDEERYSSRINTVATVATIRHTVDTSDVFYEQEEEIIQRELTSAMPYMQAFNFALLDSPFKKDIDAEILPQLIEFFAEKSVK